MFSFLVHLLAFVVAISVLVAVHEYGHFIVARKLGFKVLRFSIGFGRPLLRWRSGGGDPVEYWISAIPLGGYVKMLDERETEAEVPPEDLSRAFNRRPVPARIAVLLAGPGANFLFAIVAVWAIYLVGVEGMRPYIGGVEPGSVAARAGLRADDIIDAVGGEPTPTLDQALVSVVDELLGDGIIDLDVSDADGAKRHVELDVRDRVGELTEPDALFPGLGIDIGPRLSPVISEVAQGRPAAAAGFAVDDRIVAIDGQPIRDWADVTDYISARPGQSLDVTVERGGRRLDLEVVPAAQDVSGKTVGRIGIGRPPIPEALRARIVTERHYGVVEGLGVARRETWDLTTLTLRMLGRMVTGEVSIRNASGPIGIAVTAGDAAEAGLDVYIRMLCMLSISLGIMNLLPVPILDGGQIVMSVVEGLKGSPISMRAAIIGQQVGIAMLIALMGVVFYNDITRLLGL